MYVVIYNMYMYIVTYIYIFDVSWVVGRFGYCVVHLGSNFIGDIYSLGALVCNEILGCRNFYRDFPS